jgi:hypothetical protein
VDDPLEGLQLQLSSTRLLSRFPHGLYNDFAHSPFLYYLYEGAVRGRDEALKPEDLTLPFPAKRE